MVSLVRIVTSHEKFLVGIHFRDHILILHRLITFSLKTFGKWRNGPQSFLDLHQRHLQNPQSKLWPIPLSDHLIRFQKVWTFSFQMPCRTHFFELWSQRSISIHKECLETTFTHPRILDFHAYYPLYD